MFDNHSALLSAFRFVLTRGRSLRARAGPSLHGPVKDMSCWWRGPYVPVGEPCACLTVRENSPPRQLCVFQAVRRDPEYLVAA